MKRIFTATCLLVLLASSVASGQPVQVTTLTDTLHASGGMAMGPDGNLYVADWVTDFYGIVPSLSTRTLGTEVHRIFPDGTHEVFADSLDGPYGLAFDADGNLYVSQEAIQRISPDGIVSGYFTSGLPGVPAGMVLDAEGNLFVAVQSAGGARHRIINITTTRINTLITDSGLLNGPIGMTADNDGNLYVSNVIDGAILQITSDGTVTQLARIPGGGSFLTFANDRLYVVGLTDLRIYQVTLEGDVSAIAGTGFPGLTDGSAFEASFLRPFGIAASVTGDTLYVNDSGDVNSSTVHPNAIRMITGVKNAQTSPVANEDAEVPAGFFLAQNYPNPFNPATEIRFDLREAVHVQFVVYDVMGREVAHLVDGTLLAGVHRVTWEASHLPSGVYLYRLTAGPFSQTKAMTLLR